MDLSICKACLLNCEVSLLDQQAEKNCGLKLITRPNCIMFRSANSLKEKSKVRGDF